MEITENKDIRKVAQRFGQAAAQYHQEAHIQRKVAEGLLSSLLPWQGMLPDAPILEIGCGTGFLTKLLLQHFPEKEFVITDVSEEMLDFCRANLESEGLLSDKITFEVLDANEFQGTESKYAMVISNFAPQWFHDTAIVLEKLSDSLVPGGLLLCSFPGNHTFEQWYECCLELGLPYTANTFPDVEEMVIKLSMGPMQIDYYENDLIDSFESSLDFFRNLKAIGADHVHSGKKLTYKQFKLLTDHWDSSVEDKVEVKWHVVYLAAKKDL